MRDSIEPETNELLANMRLAAMYNQKTGASLTHWDIEGLGMIEESRIIAAIQLWEI